MANIPIYSIAFLMTTLASNAHCAMVKQRFDQNKLKSALVRVPMPTELEPANVLMWELNLMVCRRLLNCTHPRVANDTLGQMSTDGSYTGLLGMIQRNEADIALVPIRMDLLAELEVTVGPVILETDINIYSARPYHMYVSTDLLDSLRPDNDLVVKFTMLFIFIVGTLLILSEIKESDKVSFKLLTKSLKRVAWSLWRLSVRQLKFTAKSFPTKCLLFILSLVSIVFYGIMLKNLIHAQPIVALRQPALDSIFDIPKFRHAIPYMLNAFGLLTMIKNAPSYSYRRMLYTHIMDSEQRCISTEENNCKPILNIEQSDGIGKFLQTYKKVQMGRAYMIAPSQLMDGKRLNYATCRVLGREKLYQSWPFSWFSATSFFNVNLDSNVRKYVEFRQRSNLEAALMDKTLDHAFGTVLDVAYGYADSRRNCEESYQNYDNRPDINGKNSIRMYSRILFACLCFTSFAVLVWILEFLVKYFYSSRENERQSTRTEVFRA